MCVGLFVEDRSRRYVCGVDVCVGGCLARKCKEGMCVGVVGVCVSRWCGQVGVRVRVRGACGCAFRGSVWKQVACVYSCTCMRLFCLHVKQQCGEKMCICA